MQLYTDGQGRWVGTQADAKKELGIRGTPSVTEVPVDKAGLLKFLNTYKVGEATAMNQFVVIEDARYVSEGLAPSMKPKGHMTQEQVDAMFTPKPESQKPKERLFSSGNQIDEICNTIEELDGHHLGNVAMAVACRLKELAK